MYNKINLIILGIETSCDETSASLIEVKRGNVKILSNIVSSQIKVHQKYGGVVPELAAREHLKNIIPVVKKALVVSPKKIDYLAIANGPGLVSSLFVGVEAAKTLAYVWQKPIIAINHMEAHIYANWLDRNDKDIKFPALSLIVSGGHTELILIKGHGNYKKFGQTLDDAAGECFDKVAKMLNIGYPGGPIIEKFAKKGNPSAYNFPRPMFNSHNFNFSFSGLKTAVLYKLRDLKKEKKNIKRLIPNLAAGVQQAIADVLIDKTIRAAKKYRVKTVLLAGGVAANQQLRDQLNTKCQKLNVNFFVPLKKFCTDNAAMVAMAGYFHAIKKDFTPFEKIKVNPQLDIK